MKQKKELKWLVSLIMSVIMTVSVLANPVMAVAETSTDQSDKIIYVNSDGEEIPVSQKDGFYYAEVNSDGQDVVKIYGYKGPDTKLKVPAEIDGKPVVSFAIDPRWPVTDEYPYDETYDQITEIQLPECVMFAHARFMKYFTGLQSISIGKGNDNYKSENGILYRKNDSGCEMAAYPRAKADTSYVMPDDMNRMYSFFEDCPLKSLTLSKAIDYVSLNDFRWLEALEEIKVAEGNQRYTSKDGLLYVNEPEHAYVYDPKTDKYVEVIRDIKSLIAYPVAKRDSVYVIPYSSVYFYSEALQNAKSVETLVLPEKVEYLDLWFYDNMPNLKTIKFTAKKAPDEKEYEYYRGIQYLLQERPVEIVFPENGEGYETFLKWLVDGEESNERRNYWSNTPWLYWDCETIPLGANLHIYGESAHGKFYKMYSKSKEGPFTDKEPDTTGVWYVKCVVDETEKYDGLESKPMEFTVTEAEEGKAYNYFYTTYSNPSEYYGTDYNVNQYCPARYGTTKYYFKPLDAEDKPENWTEEKPVEIGMYNYKGVVDETDSYSGIVSSINTFEIMPLNGWVGIQCDNIVVGETPTVKITECDVPDIDPQELEQYFVFERFERYGNKNKGRWVPADSFDVPGNYSVEISHIINHHRIEGGRIFKVISKGEYVTQEIKKLPDVRGILPDDEETIKKARHDFDALTENEKAEVDPKYVNKLKSAEGRIAFILAEADLINAQEEYDASKNALDASKSTFETSKKAADAAASTPGQDAIDKAEKALKDAEAYRAAAMAANSIAVNMVKAAEKAVTIAEADTFNTRRFKQNAKRNQIAAAELEDLAKQAVIAAERAVSAASSAKDAAITAAKLASKKENAKKELATYRQAVDVSKYGDDVITALDKAKDDGVKAIDKASSENTVAQALNDAKSAIDTVKKNAEDAIAAALDAKKAVAKEELAAYRAGKKNTQYDADGVKALNAAKSNGDKAIDAAADEAAVTKALSNAKAKINSVKKKNTMTVTAKKITLKASALKKKTKTVSKKSAFSVSKAKGTVTFKMKKISNNIKKYISISKSGKITVKKGLQKGKYSFKVNVTAAGNKEYKKITKSVKVNITVQ